MSNIGAIKEFCESHFGHGTIIAKHNEEIILTMPKALEHLLESRGK